MKVKISAAFQDKLNKQVEFIAKNKPGAARKFKNDILSRIKEIPEMPYRNRQSVFFEKEEIREFIFKGYLVVYKIDKAAQEIIVFGFLKYEDEVK